MNIYIVTHYWDNGETYPEDRIDFEEHKMYSTLALAQSEYYSHITDDYEGKYTLTEKTLDTQEERKLEESPWVECKCFLDCCDYNDDNCCCNDYYEYPDPEKSVEDFWRWYDMCKCQDEYRKNCDIKSELDAEREWLTHKGENWEIFEEIKKDRENKLINELLVELNQL